MWLSFCVLLPVLLCITGDEVLDIRLSKGHVSRGKESVRITVISNTTLTLSPSSTSTWEQFYSEPFKYRWTDKVLNTGVMEISPDSSSSSFNVNGEEIKFDIPQEGEGVVGTIIADPCFNNEYLNWCAYGDEFQTLERTPALLNAINSHKDTHYWGILGDNFYDQNGVPTSLFFNKLSLDTKTKLFLSVPGNHDYWLSGTPQRYDVEKDQQANGFMQYYGQDAYASLITFPYDYSVDPDAQAKGQEITEPARRAKWSNFHIVQKIGNVGVVGFSGAAPWEEQQVAFNEACNALNGSDIDVILVMGHWDVPVFDIPNGLEPGMSVEAIHLRMRTLPACAALPQRKFKYIYGHTHCNRMMLRDTSYLVAGQGMDGCGIYGFPVFDTTNGAFKVHHFLIQDHHKQIDNYAVIKECIEQKGVTQCYHLAEEWTVQEFEYEK